MPRTKRAEPIYQRGKFKLFPRKGRNLEIVWYDPTTRRERCTSAGTTDIRAGEIALDRKYLESAGRPTCPTCHRPWDGQEPDKLATAINDYMLLSDGKAGYKSAKTRLSHVRRYLEATDTEVNCIQIDEAWIERFRKWRLKEKPKPSLSHVEGSVMQLAAAINQTHNGPANFKARQFKTVSNSPTYRADIAKLAEMFDYALAYNNRDNLLRYLRAAVATWARPDAVYDINSANWVSNARVLKLNPADRPQTKKYRPAIPIPHQFAPFIDDLKGIYIPVNSIKSSWGKMRVELEMPEGRQAGEKLIRRSIATLARERLGEEYWQQGRAMLGHIPPTTSDVYALPNPAHLGRALAVAESIIEDIEELSPNAFSRVYTAPKFDYGQFRRSENG